MWTPQSLQACRWMVAFSSTAFSLWPFFVTLSWSRGMTAHIEKSAPAGFQHFVQPHA
jgi:hypothetical protein